ncbi:MAG: carboxypeptidase regulatory-like domain-containing protein [Planctomycetota bacterium]|nr:MAG: carboxypeptidase regulatory-like domain-containing protein [Planctomycetota bacterium]
MQDNSTKDVHPMRSIAPLALIFSVSISFAPDLATAQESTRLASETRQRVLTPVAQPISTFHTGWGVLDRDGVLQGQVVTLNDDGTLTPQADVEVVIEEDARILGRAVTDEDGKYRIEGLQPGVYYLIARGTEVYAAHSLELLVGDKSVPMYVYATDMEPKQAEQLLRELWSPNPRPRQAEYGAVAASPSMVRQSHEYVLTDGGIHGQLAFPYRSADYAGHIVRAYREGELIGVARVDEYARFFLPVNSPGVTDLVVGGAGFAHVSAIYLVAPEQVTLQAGPPRRFVSTPASPALQQPQTLIIPVRPSPVAPEEPVVAEPVPSTVPFVPGGMAPGSPVGGGGFAGGGAGGGGGGFGAVIGAAGLAVGIAALSDDDEGFNVNLATGIAP